VRRARILHPLARRGVRWVLAAVVLVLAGLAATAQDLLDFDQLRQDMVEHQLRDRGITDERVLKAMGEVPRHLFVPEELQSEAYADKSLPVGKGSSIHQPYVVALMTTQLKLDRGAKVLEIGTGSGYHAAVLGRLARQVFTIEIDPDLGRRAKANLQAAAVRNVHTRIGDGYLGWPEEGPFDAIILTAAPKRVPPPLFDQLRIGGVLVLPEGGLIQNLVVYTRTEQDYERKVTVPVSLPKMTGKAEGEKPR
jgi:protein-L-isoaspartate(D-aspartate) O-methyltransferase